MSRLTSASSANNGLALYVNALRFALTHQANAYGFTLVVWGTGALATWQIGKPNPADVFAFLGGAVVSISLIVAVVLGLWHPFEELGPPRRPFSAMHLASAPAAAAAGWALSFALRGDGGPVTVALDAAGNAVAVWSTQSSDAVLSASRTAGGRWSLPQTITQQPYVSEPALAVSPRGDAIAVWRRVGSSPTAGRADVIQAATRRPSGAFGLPQDISDPGDLGGNPRVGISTRGVGVAVWEGVRAVVDAATFSP